MSPNFSHTSSPPLISINDPIASVQHDVLTPIFIPFFKMCTLSSHLPPTIHNALNPLHSLNFHTPTRLTVQTLSLPQSSPNSSPPSPARRTSHTFYSLHPLSAPNFHSQFVSFHWSLSRHNSCFPEAIPASFAAMDRELDDEFNNLQANVDETSTFHSARTTPITSTLPPPTNYQSTPAALLPLTLVSGPGQPPVKIEQCAIVSSLPVCITLSDSSDESEDGHGGIANPHDNGSVRAQLQRYPLKKQKTESFSPKTEAFPLSLSLTPTSPLAIKEELDQGQILNSARRYHSLDSQHTRDVEYLPVNMINFLINSFDLTEDIEAILDQTYSQQTFVQLDDLEPTQITSPSTTNNEANPIRSDCVTDNKSTPPPPHKQSLYTRKSRQPSAQPVFPILTTQPSFTPAILPQTTPPVVTPQPQTAVPLQLLSYEDTAPPLSLSRFYRPPNNGIFDLHQGPHNPQPPTQSNLQSPFPSPSTTTKSASKRPNAQPALFPQTNPKVVHAKVVRPQKSVQDLLKIPPNLNTGEGTVAHRLPQKKRRMTKAMKEHELAVLKKQHADVLNRSLFFATSAGNVLGHDDSTDTLTRDTPNNTRWSNRVVIPNHGLVARAMKKLGDSKRAEAEKKCALEEQTNRIQLSHLNEQIAALQSELVDISDDVSDGDIYSGETSGNLLARNNATFLHEKEQQRVEIVKLIDLKQQLLESFQNTIQNASTAVQQLPKQQQQRQPPQHPTNSTSTTSQPPTTTTTTTTSQNPTFHLIYNPRPPIGKGLHPLAKMHTQKQNQQQTSQTQTTIAQLPSGQQTACPQANIVQTRQTSHDQANQPSLTIHTSVNTPTPTPIPTPIPIPTPTRTIQNTSQLVKVSSIPEDVRLELMRRYKAHVASQKALGRYRQPTITRPSHFKSNYHQDMIAEANKNIITVNDIGKLILLATIKEANYETVYCNSNDERDGGVWFDPNYKEYEDRPQGDYNTTGSSNASSTSRTIVDGRTVISRNDHATTQPLNSQAASQLALNFHQNNVVMVHRAVHTTVVLMESRAIREAAKEMVKLSSMFRMQCYPDPSLNNNDRLRDELLWDSRWAEVAYIHSKDMGFGRKPFAHVGFQKRCKMYQMENNITTKGCGENLAMGQGQSIYDMARCAVDGWIVSPGHRANLLGQYKWCGIGLYRAPDGGWWATQMLSFNQGDVVTDKT